MGMRGMWMIPTVVLGCGPAVATDGGQSADGSGSSEGTSSATGATVTTAPDPSGDPSGNPSSGVDTTSDSGAEISRCVEVAPIDVAPLLSSAYQGAARLSADAPMHLLFEGEQEDGTRSAVVLAAETIAGPWAAVQVLDGRSVRDVGDLDGDGKHEVVLTDGGSTWWSAQPDGTLVERGPILVDDYDASKLVRIPGDARAGLAGSVGDLEISRGNGDGTFADAVVTPTPFRDLDFVAPVNPWGEGVIEVGTWLTECIGFCTAENLLLAVDDARNTQLLATIDLSAVVVGVGDTDGDALPDWAIIDGDHALVVHRGADPDELDRVAEGITHARLGDFDGDGDADLMTIAGAVVATMWNDTTAWATPLPVDTVDGTTARLGIPADTDGDGQAEVVLSDYATDSHVLLHMVACGG